MTQRVRTRSAAGVLSPMRARLGTDRILTRWRPLTSDGLFRPALGGVILAVVSAVTAVGFCSDLMVRRVASERAFRDDTAPAVDARLVGRWVSASGKHILVARTGALWADPDLLGQLAPVSPDTGHLVVAGDTFWCSYAVAFPSRDVTEWTLQDRTQGTPCPTGRFERSFTF